MMKFREVSETRETREEKEKRITKESNLSKIIKERKGELEMNIENLDQPVVKEINNEGERKMEMKDYVGYLVEDKNVNLEKFEVEFMELEKARLDKVIPINDLKEFIKNAKIALSDLSVIDDSEETIFEGLKAANIMFRVMKDGDTYRTFNERLAKNEILRKAYNVITQNVFEIYKKAGLPDLDIA